MAPSALNDPTLTIALALVAGMFAQATAQHLRIPGIVLLLATGVLLGPDVLGIVRPADLGASLGSLVGFAARRRPPAGLAAAPGGADPRGARQVRKDFKLPRVWAAVRRGHLSVTEGNVRQAGGHVLFGAPRNLGQWTHRLDQGAAAVERWRRIGEGEGTLPAADALPLAVQRGRRAFPVDEETACRQGDELYVAVDQETRDEVGMSLRAAGWEPAAIG
jgi:hypothetical protein